MASQEILRRIVHVFRKYPSTRNDDRILAERYYQIFYPHEFNSDGSLKKNALRRMINQDHIVRARGRIQNDLNLFLPTTEAARKNRKKTYPLWKAWLEIAKNRNLLNHILNEAGLL